MSAVYPFLMWCICSQYYMVRICVSSTFDDIILTATVRHNSADIHPVPEAYRSEEG